MSAAMSGLLTCPATDEHCWIKATATNQREVRGTDLVMLAGPPDFCCVFLLATVLSL